MSKGPAVGKPRVCLRDDRPSGFKGLCRAREAGVRNTASDEAGTAPQRVWNAKLRGPDHTQCNVRGGLEAFTFGNHVL